MKNLLSISYYLLVLSVPCFAQKADIAVAKATYEFIHIRDTTKRDKPYIENMALILGRYASFYRSLSKQQQEELLAKQVADQSKALPTQIT